MRLPHRLFVAKHLADLSFIINAEKSVLSLVRNITFLSLSLDSISFTAHLSEERVKTIRVCLALFPLHKAVSFRLWLRLLGLMASAILVVQLGLLFMREFQRWVASFRLVPVRHGAYNGNGGMCAGIIPMATSCFSDSGGAHGSRAVPEGGHYRHEPVQLGRCLRSVISERPLEQLLIIWRSWPFLRRHQVLVRMDNTTKLAYINHQGELCSRQLHTLTCRLILWSSEHFLSLRATCSGLRIRERICDPEALRYMATGLCIQPL